MPISFLNVPESDELNTSRPTGYKFPVGLSTAGGSLSVDYLIVAGGGGSYFGVLGVFGILHSLIQLLGLRKYEKIKEHGFFYSFGFWTSMFGWWFIGIPLFLWLIISLLS